MVDYKDIIRNSTRDWSVVPENLEMKGLRSEDEIRRMLAIQEEALVTLGPDRAIQFVIHALQWVLGAGPPIEAGERFLEEVRTEDDGDGEG